MCKAAAVNIFLWILVAACATDHSVRRLSDGIELVPTAPTGNVKKIRILVVTPEIMQVVAAAADTFSTARSLVIADATRKDPVEWTLSESGADATITTSAVTAKISKKTGEVTFFDVDGKIILKESPGGGKTFTPTTVDGVPMYSVRQTFESGEDEAFYGLGGHQNGEMNYKGRDVELAQHNIVDVIPFLYSNRNYGLLWDNYSITRFGDPRQHKPLNSLHLLSKDGKPGGLTADYYIEGRLVKSFIEDQINYEFLETPEVENFPKDIANRGKVVWQGSMASEHEGVHKFVFYASGYLKVWIDDALVIDKWRQNWNPWTNKLNVEFKKGIKRDLRIEWTPQGGFLSVKQLDPVPLAEQQQLSLTSEAADEINYYFIRGANADGVISGYRTLTGKAPVVPVWAMGFWQSRERYRNQQELLDVVEEYRSRHIPLDNIVLDWQYWDDPNWGSHEFDASRFPDPAGMIRKVHDQLNAHIMISVWPKFNKGTDHFEEMHRNGFLFTNNIQKRRKDWVGAGYESTFYDPFNEAAGELFWKQIDRKLNSIGIDAWWLDATEPDMHSNLSLEERKKNMSPTALGPGAKYFNAYSLMNSKSVYEGSRKSDSLKRVFILTRSAFAGQQRYGAATWSGDIASTWSDFREQIATGINFSLSGIPYWTMDIGGFAVESKFADAKGETLEEWRELNARWFQFGAFSPIFRSHGQYPYREIYNIAPVEHEAYQSMLYYDKLRYALMPYLYSIAGWTWLKDYTLMRGLVMDFGNDPRVLGIGDQYMLGPSLMVSPVYHYKTRSREVYLPAGCGWYDFYQGSYYAGGQTITAAAPLSRMPLFVREGSIVPVGPEIEYTGQKPADPIALYVYMGKDCAFELYEDDGQTYRYEKGEYATIPMQYHEGTKTLTIGARTGRFNGMPTRRTFRIIWVNSQQPVGVKLTVADPQQVLHYDGNQITMTYK